MTVGSVVLLGMVTSTIRDKVDTVSVFTVHRKRLRVLRVPKGKCKGGTHFEAFK